MTIGLRHAGSGDYRGSLCFNDARVPEFYPKETKVWRRSVPSLLFVFDFFFFPPPPPILTAAWSCTQTLDAMASQDIAGNSSSDEAAKPVAAEQPKPSSGLMGKFVSPFSRSFLRQEFVLTPSQDQGTFRSGCSG